MPLSTKPCSRKICIATYDPKGFKPVSAYFLAVLIQTLKMNPLLLHFG